MKADLALRIAQAMYMEPDEIGEDDIFSDFGLESVTLAKILDAICRRHGCTIGIAELVRRQTLREASELIYERISAEASRAGANGSARP